MMKIRVPNLHVVPVIHRDGHLDRLSDQVADQEINE